MFKLASTKERMGFIPQLIIVYYAFSPFLYLLRALAGDAGITAIILRMSQPVLMLCTFGLCAAQGKWKWNTLSFTLLLVGFYGFIIALLQENNLVDCLGGFLHFLTGLILLLYFTNTQELPLKQFMKSLSYFTLMSYSLVTLLIYSLPLVLGFSVYLGLACQVLIVVFFYQWQQKRFLICLWTLSLILLSGKRGVLLAFGLGFGVSLIPFLLRLTLRRSVQIGAIVVLSGLLIWFITLSNERLVHKYSYSDLSNANEYSAGRLNEIFSAYQAWTSSVENMIIGNGFGFNYTYIDLANQGQDRNDYKNVHFSYFNPLIIFGIPVALIYYCCLSFLLFKLWQKGPISLSYLKWALFTYLIYSCFVFNLFDEPIFWMGCGVLLHRVQNRSEEQDFIQHLGKPYEAY